MDGPGVPGCSRTSHNNPAAGCVVCCFNHSRASPGHNLFCSWLSQEEKWQKVDLTHVNASATMNVQWDDFSICSDNLSPTVQTTSVLWNFPVPMGLTGTRMTWPGRWYSSAGYYWLCCCSFYDQALWEVLTLQTNPTNGPIVVAENLLLLLWTSNSSLKNTLCILLFLYFLRMLPRRLFLRPNQKTNAV